MTDKRIGFGITGSYCTFKEILPIIAQLAKHNTVTPVFSYSLKYDTRFLGANDFYNEVTKAANGVKPLTTLVEVEPFGPKKLLDIMVIAPCTGNTLAKLANGITDTPVLLAAKAHLRNERPLVVAVSTNDALAANAKNIGTLLNTRNIYFVPMSQDDPIQKPRSVVADFSRVFDTAQLAFEGKQIQPIFC